MSLRDQHLLALRSHVVYLGVGRIKDPSLIALTKDVYESQELRKHSVCTVVRVCEPSYDVAPLRAENIEVRDLAYDDGTFPPANVVDEWFEILRDK